MQIFPHPKQSGFTLLELLISLFILAILLGLAAPSLGTLIRRSSNVTLTNQMINLVQYARAEAITKNRTVTLCGASNTTQCNGHWAENILIFQDNDGDGQLNNEDRLIATRNSVKKEGHLQWRSFQNKPYLQLHPNGRTYYQNGNFTFCPTDGDAYYAIHWILNASGHLRIARDKNNNGIPDKANGQDIQCR